jgi:hypothetical protein
MEDETKDKPFQIGSSWRKQAKKYLDHAKVCTIPELAEQSRANAAACIRAAEDCEAKYPPGTTEYWRLQGDQPA